MKRSHYAALAKIAKNIAAELDEMSLVVDSMLDDPKSTAAQSEDVDEHYLRINDGWYWLYSWLDKQEITDEG
jgi:transposase-like protein